VVVAGIVAEVSVPDVLVIVVSVIVVSVIVVSVIIVSVVAIVSAGAAIVSIAAVSLVVASSFLQANAKSATRAMAIKVRANDFFIVEKSPLSVFKISTSATGLEFPSSRRGCLDHLVSSFCPLR
jgi:hypothetical protein